MAAILADFVGLGPFGGTVKFSQELGMLHWQDRFGRHWVRSNKRWIRATPCPGVNP